MITLIFGSLVKLVITSACHAEEHGFEPRTNRQIRKGTLHFGGFLFALYLGCRIQLVNLLNTINKYGGLIDEDW